MKVGLALFLMVGVALIIGSMESDRTLFSETAASWAQAFGSIVAVAGAAWIAVRDGRERNVRDRQRRDAAAITVVMQLVLSCKAFVTCQKIATESGPWTKYPVVLIPPVNQAIRQLQNMPIVDARNVNIQVAYETMVGLLTKALVNLQLINIQTGVHEDSHAAFLSDIESLRAEGVGIARSAVAHVPVGHDFDELLAAMDSPAERIS